MMTTKRNGRRWTFTGACLAGVMLTSSCATQQQYDEAIANWKNEQNQRIAAEDRAANLEQENSTLQAQLRQDQKQALNATYGDAMSRLAELQKQLAERQSEGPIRDIERIPLEGGYAFVIQDKVLFASGSAEISPEGKTALKGLADQINSQAHGRILVRGHTDNDPIVKPATKDRFPLGNLQLSAERAVSVAALLIDSKISGKDVVVAGYGEHEPVAGNDSADNKRLNRRVEIVVSDE